METKTPHLPMVASIAGLGSLAVVKVMIEHYLVLGAIGRFQSVAFDTVAVATILSLGLLLHTKKAFRLWLLFASVVFSVVMLVTAVYAAYFDQIVLPSAIGFAGQVGDVGGEIAELLSLRLLLLFLDIPLLVWLALRTGGQRRPAERPTSRSRWVAAAVIAVLMVTLGLRVRAIAAEPGPLDGMNVAAGMGIFAYQSAAGFHHEDFAGTLAEVEEGTGPEAPSGVHPEDPEWVIASIAYLKGASSGARLYDVEFGAAKGASVICIQVEALQTAVVGQVVDGKHITSNLDALIAESWYVPQTFAQLSGGNTSDAEFVSETSLYPPSAAASSVEYSSFEIPGLPRVLAKQGYDTFTLHTNGAKFWNRTQMYPSVGFDRYYDSAFFKNEDKIRFGSSDEVLFRRGLEVLVEDQETGTPFYAKFVTVTSHYPFNPLPESKEPYEPPAPYADTNVGGYLTHMEYADRALGGFIDELKRTGLYDECVIVVYGDHFGIADPDVEGPENEAQDALLGREYTSTDKVIVPMIVHLPGQTQGYVIPEVAGQIDIMPTIADVLGVDLSDVPHFGRSIFVDEPILVAQRRYVGEGSIATADALVYVGIDDEASYAVPLDARTEERESTESEYHALAVSRSLLALSDAYTRALPVRADYDADAPSIIPNRKK
ncbi:MAG: LTA synthase family protein [Coriobacteriia bacterium]|nr:LTA synthase family protein [Coriobacteriia bacterium]MBN2821783.1 LTA synthase family protein [Coriobacteriia bacterium]